MKLKILILAALITTALEAQESITTPPVIVAKIALGETVLFEDVSIVLKRVIEDSRCPKDVSCIWAGQAKVLVAIKSNGTTLEKELVFHGTNFGDESENTLFATDSKKYFGYRLSPYPVSSVPSGERNYQLEVLVK